MIGIKIASLFVIYGEDHEEKHIVSFLYADTSLSLL